MDGLGLWCACIAFEIGIAWFLCYSGSEVAVGVEFGSKLGLAVEVEVEVGIGLERVDRGFGGILFGVGSGLGGVVGRIGRGVVVRSSWLHRWRLLG